MKSTWKMGFKKFLYELCESLWSTFAAQDVFLSFVLSIQHVFFCTLQCVRSPSIRSPTKLDRHWVSFFGFPGWKKYWFTIFYSRLFRVCLSSSESERNCVSSIWRDTKQFNCGFGTSQEHFYSIFTDVMAAHNSTPTFPVGRWLMLHLFSAW